jgi:polar amino acid transport system permease protein
MSGDRGPTNLDDVTMRAGSAGATAQPAPAEEAWQISAVRHGGRWVSGVIIIGLLALLVRAFANAEIDWSAVGQYLTAHAILSGFLHTIEISFWSMVLASFLGLVFAIMRLSHNRVANSVAWLYVWLFRGTPVLLQLLLWFNLAIVFPRFSIPGIWQDKTINIMSPFVAALLGLGVNEGAYLTEVIRSGILSVDEGQEEASTALGLSRARALRHVVLPQALRIILPPYGNEAIGLLKTSSLAAVIAFPELLESAEQIYYVNSRVIELLLVAAAWYLVATSALSVGQYYLERRLSRGLARARPRSSFEQLIIQGLDRLSARSGRKEVRT